MASNKPRVAWTKMSLVSVRSNLGENWLLASCRVTTVSEKVRDVTVINELDTAANTVRAAAASPPNSTPPNHDGTDPSTPASRRESSTPTIAARMTAATGRGHNWVRTVSRTVDHRLRTGAHPPSVFHRPGDGDKSDPWRWPVHPRTPNRPSGVRNGQEGERGSVQITSRQDDPSWWTLPCQLSGGRQPDCVPLTPTRPART